MLSLAVIVAVNLIAVGDFEVNGATSDYRFHTFGKGAGSASRVRSGADGGWCARLAMSRGPGGAKMVVYAPLSGGASLRLAFLHNVSSGLGAVTATFGLGDGSGSFEALNLPNGKSYRVKRELHPTDGWQRFEWTNAVPPDCRVKGGLVRFDFVMWGGQGPTEMLVDNIVAEPVEAERTTISNLVSMSFLPDSAPIESASVNPIPDMFPFTYAATNGCLMRNGQAHFWFGDGCALSGYASSPAGLWLARLQGVELVTQNGASGASTTSVRDNGDTIDLWSSSSAGYYSWFRENVRFGMLAESPSGVGHWPEEPSVVSARNAHPYDFGEVVYDRGHFVGVDPLAKFGREIMLSRRLAWFGKIGSVGRMIAELNREPGPNPWNRRVRRSFRSWLRKKYGDLETLNRVWRTHYSDWDDVGPAHLPPESGRYESILEKDLRFAAKETESPRYYDWFLFMIDDTTESNRVETEDLRKHWSGFVSCDSRSHVDDRDAYANYCPDRLESLWDVYFVHQGWCPVRYATGPYDTDTLLRTTSFPLFCFNYYRTNLKRPILSVENVVAAVGVPGSSRKAMTKNDIAGFHGADWEFQLADSPDEKGWKPIKVPGCWDEQPEWKSRSGIGWYRCRFTVPAAYGHDFADGSRKFLLYGKGLAQNGEFWMNGRRVGRLEGRAWNRSYAFDVGETLKFGGENEILVRVNGSGYQNGIREYIHLLANDMIEESSLPDARMHRHMLWSFMMGGLSGDLNWNWNREDPIRPYLPMMLGKINAVAPFVLPDVRWRRGRVAVLHGYAYCRGLPFVLSKLTDGLADAVKLNAACVLQGVRTSVVSEWKLTEFLAENPVDALVVPEVKIVEDSTFVAVRGFLEKGGTVILSGHALERTFSRYAETDAAMLERHVGKGRIVRISPDLTLEAAMDTLRPYLSRPDLPVVNSGASGEKPMVERVLAGNADRKVVYLANWGACRQRLLLELPLELAGWKRTTLEGNFKDAGGRLAVEVDSQDVAVALFERPGAPTCWNGVSHARSEAMARIVDLMAEEQGSLAEDRRKKVLFPDENLTFRDAFTGMKLYPYWVLAFRQRGCRVDAVPRERWTDALLEQYDVVMLPENYKAQWVATGGAKRYGELVKNVLERGGSVCSFANVNGIANNSGIIVDTVAKLAGATWDRVNPIPEDRKRATFGDARQITTAEIMPSELTEDVRSVALYTGSPFRFFNKTYANNTVVLSCKRPVMIAAEVGKGRLFVSADAMFGQPLRIEEADNASLVANIAGWLLREPTGAADRSALRGDLFLNEDAFR